MKGRTPDGQLLASPGRRLAGYLIDAVLWVMICLLVVAALFAAFAVYFFTGDDKDESGADTTFWVSLVALLLVVGVLRLVVEAERVARRGQTWGMWAVHVRAVDDRTGGLVSRPRAWARVAFASSLSGSFLGLGYWWALFDDRRRTLHDLVCSIVVVDES